MSYLIFIRHGETSWSKTKEHRVRGRLDIPLTAHGLAQAKAAGLRLKTEPIAAIYSSPLKRAFDTAVEIAKLHELPVLMHDGFNDLNFGDWQGLTHEYINIHFSDLYQKWQTDPDDFQFPNGENLHIVNKRIQTSIKELVSKYENDMIVICTHGAVLRVILCYLHGVGVENYWQYRMDNCAFTISEFNNGNFTIIAENDNKHLKYYNK